MYRVRARRSSPPKGSSLNSPATPEIAASPRPDAPVANPTLVDSAFLIAVLDSATDVAVIATDHNGDVTLWSEGAYRLSGWPAEEVVGSSDSLIFTQSDLADGAAERERAAALASGRTVEERWRLRRDGSRFWAGGVLAPLFDNAGDHTGFIRMLRDLSERHELEELRKKAAEHQLFLRQELEHRLKNLLALAQGIVSQSLRNATSIPDAKVAIDERLVVLGRAHDILTRTDWAAANLRQMVEEVTGALGEEPDRIRISGPDCELAAKPALALSLALHELGTNAVKYGALSVDEGHVEISWRHAARGIDFEWREVGGPPVVAPTRRGFGSRLIESAATDFAGAGVLTYEPTGVVWRLKSPLGVSFAEPPVAL